MAGTGDFIVTCTFETREATGDGDRLAHNPEVITCPATLDCTWRSTLLLEPIHVLGS